MKQEIRDVTREEQTITKKQYEGLSDDEAITFWKNISCPPDVYKVISGEHLPTIGQMIEFIRNKNDGWSRIEFDHINKNWYVSFSNSHHGVYAPCRGKKILRDVLWQAVLEIFKREIEAKNNTA